jgi:competence protein ComEC
VVRAAIMASLSILAALLGRKQAGVNTLCLAGTVMLAFNPAVLWDVGFQLSFTATLGLIWFGNPLTENFKSAAGRWLPSACLEKTARIVGDYLLLTLAAQLTTFPLLLYYFHQLPLASLLANPLVLPAQPPLMILTGLAVLLGHVWLPLGNLVAWAALPFASYTLLVVDWLAGLRLPGIWLPRTSVISIAAYYGLLTALVYWKPLREKMKTLFRPLVGLGLAVLAAYLACLALAEKPDGRLHIYLAGGDEQGAVLVASPTGRYVLLGSGDDSPALLQFTGQRTPRLASALDALVLDGRDPASLRAAALALTQLRPAAIYLPESAAAAGSLNTLRAAAGEIGVEIQTLTIGTVLNLGDGAVLKTEYGNAAGSAYRLEWQGFSMALYPPETACETKSALVVLSADRWSCPQYQPALSIQLAGDGQAEPGTINLTARGWVHIQTDGTRYWVETER